MPLGLGARFLALGLQASISAVGLEFARLYAIEQKIRQRFLENPIPQSRGRDWPRDLDPAEEIPRHPVGARKKYFRLSGILETVNAAVLEKPADDADDANVFAHLRNLRPQTTNAAHDEIDGDFGAGGFVELLDDLAIDQRIHFRDDSGRFARARICDLAVDQPEEALLQIERRHHQFL